MITRYVFVHNDGRIRTLDVPNPSEQRAEYLDPDGLSGFPAHCFQKLESEGFTISNWHNIPGSIVGTRVLEWSIKCEE